MPHDLDQKNQPVHGIERYFHALMETLGEGVLVRNEKGEILAHNTAALRLLQVSAGRLQDVLRRNLISLIDERGYALDTTNMPSTIALQTGVAQRNKLIGFRAPNAELRWFMATSIPIMAENSEYQVMTTFRDVTAERNTKIEFEKVQERLQAREQFFSGTLDRLPCLVSYVSPALNYEYVNATFERWHGLKLAEVRGKSVKAISGPVVFAAIESKLRRALAGEIVRFEAHIPSHPRGVIHSQLHYYPDFDEQGGVRGIYAVVEDITQVKVAAQALRETERLTMMLDSLPGSVSYWGLDCRNIHANQACAKNFNMSAADLKGMHMRELIGDELFDLDEPAKQILFTGQAVNCERKRPNPNGGFTTYLISFLPELKNSELTGFFVMSTDISQIKIADAEKREMEAKLVAASKMSSLGEMAGGVAHEINNPLAIISGRASIIQSLLNDETPNLERAQTELERINGTVERIAKIIRGLKAFARNAEGDAPSTCSLRVILNDTVELCQERMKNLGIEFRYDFPVDVEIECRPAQISQVIMNLIGNSIDAIEGLSAKWIEVRVSRKSGSVVITVADSGNGIPDGIIEKMMNPFFTTKDIGKGTGLGLSISKGLAEKNNGQLRYVKASNTTFALEINLEPQSDAGAVTDLDVKLAS